MRRGGASTLSALGVAGEDIARVGWDPKSQVWRVYANTPHTLQARALATSRMMDALAGRVSAKVSPVKARPT